MSWASAVKRVRYETEANFVRPVITLARVDWARVVTVDFETFYSVEYTLSKLSTSEYVRDPRFKAQMVGIKIGDKPTKVYGPKQIKAALAKINWTTHSLLCHNTQFDGFILHHHYGIKPAFYYDTLSMARGLHSNEIGASLDEVAQFYGSGSKIEGALEQTKGVLDWPKTLFDKTAVYCTQDVDLTYDIFKKMQAKYPAEEIDMIDLTMRMFCDPVLKVDIPRVEKELERELAEREQKFYAAVNPRDWDGQSKELLKTKAERALTGVERDMLMIKRVIGSNERFAKLLEAEGIEPPVKISPAWMEKSKLDQSDEHKWTFAFAKDDLDFINLPADIDTWRGNLDPDIVQDVPLIVAKQQRIQDLIDCRLAVKSTTNIARAERFLTAGANGIPLPVGYAYYRAHTGRFGGNNKMNMQNLTREGELRQSILAPKGHVLAVQDSGQIEARVNGWLWDQDDLIKAFRVSDAGTGSDAYCNFASLVYNRKIAKADKDERFLGKVCVLGLGYSMGADKFQLTLAKGALGGPPIHLSKTECMKIVNLYRRTNYKIVQGWDTCKRIIEEMAAGIVGSYKCIAWEKDILWLPNGMSLKYPNLRPSVDANGWNTWTYQSGDIRKKIYGGLLCLGAKTQVLTDNGWKSIISVRLDDKLWDGANWVSHSGLVHQGVKETISFGGVDMTPDHEVLVNDHWFAAEETTHHEATSSFAQHYRAPNRHVDSSWSGWQRWSTNPVDSSLPVWKHPDSVSYGIHEGQYEELRMLDGSVFIRVKDDARYVEAPRVRSMARYARPLQSSEPQSMGTLRRARDYCLSAVDRFSGFLVRYADWVQAGLGAGPREQLTRVHPGELPLGNEQDQLSQHTLRAAYPDTKWPNAVMAGCRGVWDWEDDVALPPQPPVAFSPNVRQAGRQQQDVFDLVNAGPLRRFTVRGDDGMPFIVHNCENIVQALARIIVMSQMMDITKKYRVVMTTHDEVVTMPKKAQAEACTKFMYHCMTTPLPWCKDIPLNAEGGWAVNYSK